MRRARGEEGYSLVELVVVMVIVGVLLAVAVPTFLGAQNRAHSGASKAVLRIASKAVVAYTVDHNDTLEADAAALAELQVIEPALDWVAGSTESEAPTTVSVAGTPDQKALALALRADGSTCFYLRVTLQGAEARHHDAFADSCVAEDFTAGAGAGW